MISYFIAFYTNESVNWGMAARARHLVLLVDAARCSSSLNRLGRDRPHAARLRWRHPPPAACSSASGTTPSALLCALIFAFLLLPIVVIIPLSFNAGEFFTYPLRGLSLRWYEDLFTNPMWLAAARNSFIVGAATTVLATVLGTLAALGLAAPASAARR